VRFSFGRRLRHPFFPALKLTAASFAPPEVFALCGGFEELCRAAAGGVRVDRAVFPLRPPSSPFLPHAQRETLWRRFEVPVFALLVDARDAVIGYECEAQHGIHLVENYTPGLLFGRIDSSPCECGRPGLRLLPPPGAEEIDLHVERELVAG
jgi:hypothetical protein